MWGQGTQGTQMTNKVGLLESTPVAGATPASGHLEVEGRAGKRTQERPELLLLAPCRHVLHQQLAHAIPERAVRMKAELLRPWRASITSPQPSIEGALRKPLHLLRFSRIL